MFALSPETTALVIVLAAVLSLIVMIAWAKVQPLLAFVVASILAALLAFGAIFGKIVADSGAAKKISKVLIGLFGDKRIAIALCQGSAASKQKPLALASGGSVIPSDRADDITPDVW